MGAKRALIVDDSKSARLFLARVLEKYDIDVDSAESAEAAIDYLTSNRPDVIFMDHLMPGMDGLQAVQAIKNDPRTATIPIMMYTSQEGELYLGQARALGAVGVLPKQIKPTDVSKVLYQLHLVPDRRTPEQSSFTPLNVRVEGEAGELRRASCPSPSPTARCASTSRSCAARWSPASTPRPIASRPRCARCCSSRCRSRRPARRPSVPLRAAAARRGAPPWPWLSAGAGAGASALASTALWWRNVRLLESLSTDVAQLRAQRCRRDGRRLLGTDVVPAYPPPRAGCRAPQRRRREPIVVPVPYGADALGGARLEVIRKLLDRLAAQKRPASSISAPSPGASAWWAMPPTATRWRRMRCRLPAATSSATRPTRRFRPRSARRWRSPT